MSVDGGVVLCCRRLRAVFSWMMCAFTRYLTRKLGGINVLTTPYRKVATELPVGLAQSCLARYVTGSNHEQSIP
jgi:hypothetical protein